MIVYAVVDDFLSRRSPLGDAVETFIRREDAERFIEEVRQTIQSCLLGSTGFFARRCRLAGQEPFCERWRANRRLLALALRVARPAVTGVVRPPLVAVNSEPRLSQPKRGTAAASWGARVCGNVA